VQTPFLGELPEGFRPCRAQPLRLRALRPRRTRSSPATSVVCEACPDHPDASARKRAARRTCFRAALRDGVDDRSRAYGAGRASDIASPGIQASGPSGSAVEVPVVPASAASVAVLGAERSWFRRGSSLGAIHQRRDSRAGRGDRRVEGPWRGTKPMEGQGAASPATAVQALRTRRRSKASRPTSWSNGERRASLATEATEVRRCDRGERRGGNGRGDAVRLSARGVLRGV
jgi:hypothetical protein